jgi:hypothetical protein
VLHVKAMFVLYSLAIAIGVTVAVVVGILAS